MAAGVVIGVDFGTSFTVAAIRRGQDAPTVIEVAGVRRTPSVVFAEEDGSLVVGAAAEALTAARPARGLRAPKQLLGRSSTVVLGGARHPLPSVIAGVLRPVLRHADREARQPAQLVFTHPADWSELQLAPFREALAQAGAHLPELVPEPVAGAWAQAAGYGHQPGDHLVVYDLGGGTLDIAVLQVEPVGFEVAGRPKGNRALGGDLFDEVLMRHVGERHIDAAAWEELQLSDDPAWSGSALRLRAEVRRAKELLSLHPRADVTITLPERTFAVVLERSEVVRLLQPMVEESVQLCEDTVLAAGLPIEAISAVHLIGGGSQLPSIGEAVGARFPRSELVLAADPKAVVALGATLLASPQPVTQPALRSSPPPPDRLRGAAPPSVTAPPASPVVAPPAMPQVGAIPTGAAMPAGRAIPSGASPPPSPGLTERHPDGGAGSFRVHEGAQLGAQRRRALLGLALALACISVAVLALVMLR
ncbi:MAG: Hsp70 family protein [Acidimicrobiales bacterium]